MRETERHPRDKIGAHAVAGTVFVLFCFAILGDIPCLLLLPLLLLCPPSFEIQKETGRKATLSKCFQRLVDAFNMQQA